ncbi:MAG: hypothetical protein HZB99_04225 [Candidatus Harrisonbacteria bacterium]|nr:hypothetical protein [Candidatus Harrisonbacteria bacterium]
MNQNKLREVYKILESCIGKKGVWAGIPRYKDQCWTRDFVIAVEDVLLNSDRPETVKNHLKNLGDKQWANGQIPIMFLDNTSRWLLSKIWKSIIQRRKSFLLAKFFSKGGIGDLSSWTRDSEILYILGLMNYVNKTNDKKFLAEVRPKIKIALDYIENVLMENELVYGGDWRDTRPDLDHKFLLTNNCSLYWAYKLLGESEKSKKLKESINQRFWNGKYYRNYLGGGSDENAFDTLGNALAVIYGVADKKQTESIFNEVECVNTKFGYMVNGVTLPPKNKEEEEIMNRTPQHSIIWPFINGFMILALLSSGKIDKAKKQFKKWNLLDGFREFYDPVTGKGGGSHDQLWSACLYIRVYNALRA